jgi:hypothetical protein
MQSASVDRRRPSWALIVTASLATGGLVLVLVALVRRYLLDEGFHRGEAAGTAVGPFLVWLALGALVRSGRFPRRGGRRPDGR